MPSLPVLSAYWPEIWYPLQLKKNKYYPIINEKQKPNSQKLTHQILFLFIFVNLLKGIICAGW
jgi:hypothetical protein